MNYKHIYINSVIKIDALTNIECHNIDRNYVYQGESHDFWEMHYVRRGSIYAHTHNEFYTLKQGELTLYQPNKFHVVYGNGNYSSEFAVFSFLSESPYLYKIANSIITLSTSDMLLLEEALRQSALCFENTPNSDTGFVMKRRLDAPFGGEQLLLSGLEAALLGIYCHFDGSDNFINFVSHYTNADGLAASIREYIKNNVYKSLTLSDISEVFDVSVSHIKAAYRREYGTSVISDFNSYKIECAKKLLTESGLSIREIAFILSYDNAYYFSNVFKKYTQISPSKYRSENT